MWEKFKTKVKVMWDEEPEKVIVLGVIILGATIKVVQAIDEHKRTVIYDREIDRRRMMAGLK